MKIGVHMLALNTGPYVWWALKSSYSAVDYVAVVEGAITHDEYGNKYDHVPATAKGLSLDNTSAEVRRFIEYDDPEHKVHFTQVGFVDSWQDLRNTAHRMLPRDTDIELIQDADCLYKPAELLRAAKVLEEHPEIYEIPPWCHTFLWDFRTVMLTTRKWKNFWRWTFFRYNSALHFAKERTLTFRDDTSTLDRIHMDYGEFLRLREFEREEAMQYVVYNPDLLHVYHFGNVQEKERMETHLMRKFFSPQTRARNKLELPDLKRETLVAWLQFYHKQYTHTPDVDTETFDEFVGTYPLPELLPQHPYFDKPRSWFRHDDPEGDASSPFYEQRWWE